MIVEIKINICKNKYGADLANTELKIDSDHITEESVGDLVRGMVASAIQRATTEEEKQKQVKPEVHPTIADMLPKLVD